MNQNSKIAHLTLAISRGSNKAFDEFYQIYKDKLYAWIKAIYRGDEDLADEAFQETMFRTAKYLKPLPDEEALWAWLRRVAKSSIADQLKKKHKLNVQLDESTQWYVPLTIEDNRTDALEKSLLQLSDQERELIELKYQEGESTKQLADQFKTTPKAIESKLARLKKKLKKWILREVKYEEN